MSSWERGSISVSYTRFKYSNPFNFTFVLSLNSVKTFKEKSIMAWRRSHICTSKLTLFQHSTTYLSTPHYVKCRLSDHVRGNSATHSAFTKSEINSLSMPIKLICCENSIKRSKSPVTNLHWPTTNIRCTHSILSLGPVSNEFGYNQHPADNARIIDNSVVRFGYNEHLLKARSFFCVF